MTSPITSRRLLDADVLIDMQHKHPAALAWFASLPPTAPSVPGFVVMELHQSAQNRRQEREADVLLAPLPVVWPTETDCRYALTEFRRLHLSHGLGLIDALIAATTVGLGATLCTFTVKHCRNVDGLITEQPYVR